MSDRSYGLSGFLVVAICFLPLSVGCQAPSPPVGPTVAILDIPDYDGFVDSTLTLLREMDFQPRVLDRDNGVIITDRSTGAQWFEFWRSEVRGPYQVLESNLNTTGRIVTIDIVPEPPHEGDAMAGAPSTIESVETSTSGPAATQPTPGSYRVTVRVDKSRYSAPSRQVTTASGALGIYSERLPTTEGLRGKGTRGAHWVELGRDGLLEVHLLSRIIDRSSQVRVVDFPTEVQSVATEPTSEPAPAP